jgi:hypothetical protein
MTLPVNHLVLMVSSYDAYASVASMGRSDIYDWGDCVK